MKYSKKSFLIWQGAACSALISAGALSLPWTPALAQATPWPSKPIRFIVPGGAGGTLDTRVRWFAQRLSANLGQPIVVENKVGAGGNLGTEAGARAPADGYTLVAIHMGTMITNPFLYERVGFDSLKDFIPISKIAASPMVLTVYPGLPITSVAELVQAAKVRPNAYSFGSPGVGSPPHIAGELFMRQAAIRASHVPYKSGGQSIQDVLGGHVSFTLEGPASTISHIKAGTLRALAVSSAKRLSALPDVPTFAEAGVRDCEFMAWSGIAVPTGTPHDIVERLHKETQSIFDSAEGRSYLALTAGDWEPETLDALAKSIRAEHVLWGKRIREMGLKAQ
jgi:tripartite-type tricarboxylate transporter receptor subunit TctC